MRVVFENLTKEYPSRDRKNKQPVVAVNDFNFEIPSGKLIGLLGPSGCGKSTTLNLISGLEVPTKGKIYFDEEDVTDVVPEKRGIGLVFQNYALYPHLTVKQNIMFPLGNLKGENKLSKEAMEQKALEAAKLVQIEDLMERRPGEMSGGQQQRVAIARALVKKPRILLLDEPLSNLDARLRLKTREEIRRIQCETGITTVFVTHDQEEAMSISDMIVLMKDGEIMQIGKPQEIYDDPVNLFVAKFLGNPPVNVFDGRLENDELYIGNDMIFKTDISESKKVYVAIRPEAFELCDTGSFNAIKVRSQIMGRDCSVIFRHEGADDNYTAIVDSDDVKKIESMEDEDNSTADRREILRFRLKADKIYIFDAETEQRIKCNFSEVGE